MAKEMLPKFEPMTNIPATVVFPYGDARVIPSKTQGWAPSYLYTVELNGAAHAWFASEYAHDLLVDNNVGKGAIVTVLKGEKKGQDGKKRVDWTIDVLDPGEPVAQPVRNQGGGQAAESPEKGPARMAAGPGSRQGSEARLAELGAAYAACIDEARGVWLRSGQGLAGKLDYSTVHSTAATLMIALRMEGFDFAPFVTGYGETEGAKALRRLIERAKTEPHLEAVREHFGERLEKLPTEPAGQRALYVELREAVKSMTMAAADNTAAAEPDPDFEAPAAEAPAPAKAAPKSIPPFVQELIEKSHKVWDDEADSKAGLANLVERVTREQGLMFEDITEEQATIIGRTLDAMLARMKRG